MGDAHGDYSRLAEVVSGLGLHEHLCVIYDTQEEQFAAALPYLRTSLERGEKCLYIVDENTAAAVLDALSKGGTDVDRHLRSGALTIANKEETYLEQGRFEPDWMIGFLTEATAEASATRFSGLRTILGEMTWAPGTSNGTAKLVEYESKLNRFFRDHDARGICQYNRTRFSPELLLGIIRTHPLVVYGGIVCKNPYYIPPDEFLKPNEASREVERLLYNILAWERIQQALRHSEEKYRSIVEAASDAVISVDKNGQIFLANQAATQVFGYTLSELMGMPLTILMPEYLRDSHSAGFQRYLNTGERTMDWQRMEFIGRRKTGDRFPVEISFGEFVNNGQLTFTGFIRDITERKRAEEILASQTVQAELRADVSTAFARETELEGILQRCTEAMVRHLDAAFARIWTLKKNTSVLELRASAGMYTHLDGPHGRLLVGTLEIGHIAQQRKPLFTNEVIDNPLISDRAWAKREGIVALAGHPLVVEGRVVGVMAMFARRALTPRTLDTLASVADTIAQGIERKWAEEALRRSEACLAAGQGLSHTGSWAWNVSSGELFWSQETFSIFGFDPARTTPGINETFLPRIHPEDRPRVDAGLKASGIQKGSYGFDYRIVLPDGSIRYIHDVVYPVMNEAGTVVERYGVIMDVTERRRTEVQLQESRDQLRALAARLQMAREEERKRVAREIHDELGQSLTAIKIELSNMLFEWPPEHKPSRRAESIARLVDTTIQSVRRISTELRPGILDALGLAAAVEWVAEEFKTRTGTTCRVDLPKEAIEIDPELATTVFRILQETLTNIARHADATQVDIRLAREDGRLSLEVHDNGIGISEEQLSASGTLGILGMRERALLLGGEFLMTGAPNMGTRVVVRIPLSASRHGKRTV